MGGKSGVWHWRSQGESVLSDASRRFSPIKLKTAHVMEVNSDLSEIISVQWRERKQMDCIGERPGCGEVEIMKKMRNIGWNFPELKKFSNWQSRINENKSRSRYTAVKLQSIKGEEKILKAPIGKNRFATKKWKNDTDISDLSMNKRVRKQWDTQGVPICTQQNGKNEKDWQRKMLMRTMEPSEMTKNRQQWKRKWT